MIEHDDLDAIESKHLRLVIEKSGMDEKEIVVNLGWTRRGRVDSSKLRTVCGYQKPDKTVEYEIAVAIVEACHFDPVDFGL